MEYSRLIRTKPAATTKAGVELINSDSQTEDNEGRSQVEENGKVSVGDNVTTSIGIFFYQSWRKECLR
jgi:hypothetical protein